MALENFEAKPVHLPGGPIDAEDEPAAKKKAGAHKLDGPAAKKRHAQLWEWYSQERSKQAANRLEMALDCDFYDNLQWSQEDAEVLQSRNQAPLVFNKVAQTCDWLIGTQRRTRTDFKILPRKGLPQAAQDAENKSELLKYVADVNQAQSARSRAFEDAIKAGIGWVEVGIRGDISDEPLFVRYESWRNMLWDSCGVELNTDDWRYEIRMKWTDLDVALAMYPERAALLKSAAISSDLFGNDEDEFYYLGQRLGQNETEMRTASNRVITTDTTAAHNRRQRVKLIEMWYRNPVSKKLMRGEGHKGTTYKQDDPEHQRLVTEQAVSLYDAMVMEVRCAIMVEGGLIEDVPSPYKHNRFPFIPTWCYRRDRDGMPYGIIRRQRDPQEDLNKRMSKALHMLSSRQVIGEEDAVDDWDELREEAAKPDGIIIKRRGKELTMRDQPQLAEEHLKLAEMDLRFIETSGGVTDENVGLESNATSGKAILARQNQGSVVTTKPFDNHRMAFQNEGKQSLSLVEQFYTEEKEVRIIGPRGNASFVALNQPVIEGDQVKFLNDITEFEADFVVSEQDFRETLRQAMFEQLMDMLGKLPPEVSIQLLDLAIEFFDVPGKEEWVRRIRKINGQTDPDQKQDPQQLAEQQARQAAMQKQAALAEATAVATLKKIQSEVAQIQAKTESITADSVKASIEAIATALQAAGVTLTSPGIGAAADQILEGAGFNDRGGSGMDIAPAAGAMPMPAAPQLPPSPADMAAGGIQQPAMSA